MTSLSTSTLNIDADASLTYFIQASINELMAGQT